MQTKKVLFVCLGNICRSPTAHGVFAAMVEEAGLSDRIEMDSAGTAAYHIGKGPDPRTQAAAKTRGYDLSRLKARQAVVEDFYHYDYILAMDEDNLANLTRLQPADGTATLQLFLDFGSSDLHEVPDPYYGGEDGFTQVLDLVEDACSALLAKLKAQ